MNRIVLASVAAAGMIASGAALAADIPQRRYAPVAPAPFVPAFTWAGPYVGVNAGAAFGNDRSVFVPGVGNVGSGGNDAGFTGGMFVEG